MPKYVVNVLYHCAFDKDIIVKAVNPEEAEKKALEIAEAWTNIVDAEVTNVETTE